MFKIGKNLLFFLILIVAIIPTFYSLLKQDYYVMHDDTQMIRQLEFEKCLKDGQIPCRWSPDLGYEYGYPLFNFYPPLPYIVGQFYRTLGFSFMNSVKLSAATQIILSTIFMYFLAKSLFGRIGGLFSAIFYAYVPYHALNIYVRGAYNEAWAAVFFPLIFYFSYKLIKTSKTKNVIGLALAYSGLFLSHNPMLLTFTPFFIAWTLFWLIIEKKITFSKKIINQLPLFTKFLFSGLLSLSLTAFFVLPMIFETKYTQIQSMFQGYYHYSVHFVSLFQLFISNFWSDGASVPGPNDGLSFMVGYLHWTIPLLIVIFSLYLLIKKKPISNKIIISIFLSFLGLFSIFMAHNKSTFLWQIFAPVQKIQFPWRFLNNTAFLLSLSVGVLPYIFHKYINKKTSIIISFLFIVVLFLLNFTYFKPLQSYSITDDQKFSGGNWTSQIASGIYDYLPKTANQPAKTAAIPYITKVDPKNSIINLSGQKKGTDWLFFNLFLNQDSKITISQLAFPEFQITDKGQKIDYQIEPEMGLMVLNLKAGEHQIYVKLKNTPIRTIANYISLFAWLGLILYSFKPLWKKLIFKK